MITLLIWLITCYQKTLSPDHGLARAWYPNGYCRFHPSCSEYAKQSLVAHGVIAGSFLAIARISRCHPRSRPGYDPVP